MVILGIQFSSEYLPENPIGDEGTAAIGQALCVNKAMKRFDISCDFTESNITEGGMRQLLSCLEFNDTVDTLDRNGLPIPQEFKDKSINEIRQYIKESKKS